MKHPIEVPPELFTEWLSEGLKEHPVHTGLVSAYVARKAAEWAAEQRTHAICGWLDQPETKGAHLIHPLLVHFYPKPPSLKEQALIALDDLKGPHQPAHYNTIRRALESIPDES